MLWSLIRTVSWNGSDEGSQHMFSLQNKENYIWIILENLPYLEPWDLLEHPDEGLYPLLMRCYPKSRGTTVAFFSTKIDW